MENINFDFLKPTIIFSVIGIFVPGFTAIGLIGTQMLLSSGGIECSISWKVIWTLTTIIGIALPITFIKYIRNITIEKLETLKTKLIIFNLVEYVCIQSSIGSLFSNSKILCYGSGGQNGIELVFTAWLALPILVVLSIIFNRIID
ncbi:hypothetical protein E0I26_09115 [Flavobacterium rhamnosiphilum]|uniref:Uncharacterized protein n=1 Tax=Flavobacterium rhamnosiphilum TaxID=2541724 RepID=A0A4R5F9E2_9FLAO|nr:hypothetical protein [Flavobacterium rhamnosiphilum]TDE44512.1 hypothetical protein E0I26_09115 [Flavobacterium rhamnosiphilum]